MSLDLTFPAGSPVGQVEGTFFAYGQGSSLYGVLEQGEVAEYDAYLGLTGRYFVYGGTGAFRYAYGEGVFEGTVPLIEETFASVSPPPLPSNGQHLLSAPGPYPPTVGFPLGIDEYPGELSFSGGLTVYPSFPAFLPPPPPRLIPRIIVLIQLPRESFITVPGQHNGVIGLPVVLGGTGSNSGNGILNLQAQVTGTNNGVVAPVVVPSGQDGGARPASDNGVVGPPQPASSGVPEAAPPPVPSSGVLPPSDSGARPAAPIVDNGVRAPLVAPPTDQDSSPWAERRNRSDLRAPWMEPTEPDSSTVPASRSRDSSRVRVPQITQPDSSTVETPRAQPDRSRVRAPRVEWPDWNSVQAPSRESRDRTVQMPERSDSNGVQAPAGVNRGSGLEQGTDSDQTDTNNGVRRGSRGR
jgi:hypothetical protein